MTKHYIYETKCTGDYVGDYINNLTLAQVKSLDCDLQLEDHVQQESTPLLRAGKKRKAEY